MKFSNITRKLTENSLTGEICPNCDFVQRGKRFLCLFLWTTLLRFDITCLGKQQQEQQQQQQQATTTISKHLNQKFKVTHSYWTCVVICEQWDTTLSHLTLTTYCSHPIHNNCHNNTHNSHIQFTSATHSNTHSKTINILNTLSVSQVRLWCSYGQNQNRKFDIVTSTVSTVNTYSRESQNEWYCATSYADSINEQSSKCNDARQHVWPYKQWCSVGKAAT